MTVRIGNIAVDCDDVLTGADRTRVVGRDAEAHGWEALRDRYAELLGV